MSGKFYTIDQNNSGGVFIKNDYVDYYVSVQADSVEKAKKLLEHIVEDYSDSCDCCGERWHIWLGEKVAIIYYSDGTKERLNCIDNSVEKLDNWF